MLAEPFRVGQSMSMRLVRGALALTLGLAVLVVGAPSSSALAQTPVRVAIVVPLVVPAGTTGLVTAAELEQYTAPSGLLSRQLDEVFGQPVAIAIDPMILVSIRVLGSSAPPSVLAWLDRLARASNETFALPYANSDMTLATQAGSPRVIQAISFDFAIDPSLFAVPAEQTPSPTPTPAGPADEGAAPPLPTNEQLIEWSYSLSGVGWPAENLVVSGDMSALSAAFDTVLLASDNVVRDASAGATVDVAGTTAVVSDSAVSLALRGAVAAPTTSSWQVASAALGDSIETAALRQANSPTLLATLDAATVEDSNRLGETIDALESTAGIALVPLADLVDNAPSAATLVDLPHDAARVATMARLLAATSSETSFASILENPEDLTAQRQLSLIALTSVSWAERPAQWATSTSVFLARSKDILRAVQIVESSSFNFLADSASLPISVRNDLDHTVTVYISVQPQTALLAVGDSRVKLVIEPNSQGKGQVPVAAISNGTVEVVISLSSATGVAIGQPTSALINVQAGWETPIVLIFAALVFAVFAVGIVRRIVRGRKTVAPSSEPSDD